MIVDALDQRARYAALGDRLSLALEFLAEPQSRALEPPGFGTEHSLRVPLDGDAVFALVQRYRTKPPAEAFWEAHRRYIDVQCVLDGQERMGWMPLAETRVLQEYDEARDFMMLQPRVEAHANVFTLRAGMWAIFFPSDAHMPGLRAMPEGEDVRKIVVKVAVDDVPEVR